ncbi:Neurochondrin-domain-containing protein [Paraphysoderma sedebokerense]|nr:Neurochondrin-domain-containing protein [Paraphysoderma sedebokerense]
MSSETATPHSQLDSCLHLLQESSRDEQKFLGLLLLTKVLDPSDNESVVKSFNHIDQTFIQRLLITKSSSAEIPADTLHSVAINILLAFCNYEEIASSEQIKSTLQTVVSEFIAGRFSPDVENDVLNLLLSCSSFRKSAMSFVVDGVFDRLLEHLSTSEVCLQKGKQILSNIVAFAASGADQECIELLFESLSKSFGIQQNQTKFVSLNLLNLLLSSSKTHPSLSADAINHLQHGINDILRSKIAGVQRNPTLILVSLLFHQFECAWLFPSGVVTDTRTQLFCLIIRLTCIEIRMLLDDACPDGFKDQESENLLGCCYGILEHGIKVIVNSDEDSPPVTLNSESIRLSSDVISQLHQSIADTLDTIIEYLLDFHSRHPSPIPDLTIIATLRILSLFVSECEVPSSLPKLIPLFVGLCQSYISEMCQPEFSAKPNPLQVLAQLFAHVIVEPKIIESFTKVGGYGICTRYLKSQLLNFSKGVSSEDELDIMIGLISALLNIVQFTPQTAVTDKQSKIVVKDAMRFSESLPMLVDKSFNFYSRSQEFTCLLAAYTVAVLSQFPQHIGTIETTDLQGTVDAILKFLSQSSSTEVGVYGLLELICNHILSILNLKSEIFNKCLRTSASLSGFIATSVSTLDTNIKAKFKQLLETLWRMSNDLEKKKLADAGILTIGI